MLDRIFDVIVGFMLNSDLQKEMAPRQGLFKGRVGQIPSKILDRFIDLMMGTRHTYYMKMRSRMVKGYPVEMPSNIFDWKALERTSGYLRLYMDRCYEQFRADYIGNFPIEDFQEWFREMHQVQVERPARETTKKSVSEALLADDLPRV